MFAAIGRECGGSPPESRLAAGACAGSEVFRLARGWTRSEQVREMRRACAKRKLERHPARCALIAQRGEHRLGFCCVELATNACHDSLDLGLFVGVGREQRSRVGRRVSGERPRGAGRCSSCKPTESTCQLTSTYRCFRPRVRTLPAPLPRGTNRRSITGAQCPAPTFRPLAVPCHCRPGPVSSPRVRGRFSPSFAQSCWVAASPRPALNSWRCWTPRRATGGYTFHRRPAAGRRCRRIPIAMTPSPLKLPHRISSCISMVAFAADSISPPTPITSYECSRVRREYVMRSSTIASKKRNLTCVVGSPFGTRGLCTCCIDFSLTCERRRPLSRLT